METITREFIVYNFNELNEDAKEKVIQFYMDGQEPSVFTDMAKEYLTETAYKLDDELEVEYSFAYCQGDGLNIYGNLDMKNFISQLQNNHMEVYSKARNKYKFTEEEYKLLSELLDGLHIRLDSANRYTYCTAFMIKAEYVLDDFCYQVSSDEDIERLEKNKELIYKLVETIKDVITGVCKDLEEWGYRYFYEVDEEELQEWCEANEYKFLEDGSIF